MNQVQSLLQTDPLDMDLAPYLNNLGDVRDAVESFGRLADRLLSQDQSADLRATCPLEAANSNLEPFQQSWPSLTQSSSSSSSPLSFSSFSSQASSPAPSDQYLSLESHSSSSSSSSYFGSFSSSSGSSGPASIASSCDLGDELRRSGKGASKELRQKNASAAEKYRRRLKGREWTLMKEMEREQARNARLRRSLGAKLALYREFVALLASNTCDQDAELAKLGSRSLSAIMSEVLSGAPLSANSLSQQYTCNHYDHEDDYDHEASQEQLRAYDETELRNQLNRFQQISANSASDICGYSQQEQQQQQQQHASNWSQESQIHCGFPHPIS